MKKTLLSLVSLAMALLLVAGCSSSKKSEKQVHIGILQYVEHESLTAARKGFENELKDQGYIDGKNIKIDYQNAQGDQSNLQTISTSLLSKNDLVLGIATPAAQSLVNLSTDTPILFTAITDPVSAKLVKSMDKVGGLATGTSDRVSAKKQVALLKKVMPNLKKVGIMYTTNERNSEIQVQEAEVAFKEAGIETVVKGISSTNDVQDTTKSLMSQTEALFIPADNTIVSAITLVTDLSKEMKVPVVGGSVDVVDDGVLFTYGADFEALGRQTAKMAIRIMNGEKVDDISAEDPETLKAVANKEMAQLLGIDISAIEQEEQANAQAKKTTQKSSSTKNTANPKVNSLSKSKPSDSSGGLLDIVLSALSQGLLWSIMAIGVFITFRILDIADLTAEGSFPLGAATTAILIMKGLNPLLPLAVSLLECWRGQCLVFYIPR